MISQNEIKSYSHLAQIVNLGCKSLKVKYYGPSGDLITALLCTNSDKFDYVDRYSIYAMGGVPVYERFLEEAKELGIDDLRITDEGNHARIDYTFRHMLDKSSRPREINYYVADAFSFRHPVSDSYDVLIIRGEASPFQGHDFQMKELGENMVVGGHFISDRKIARYLQPNWIGFEEMPNSTVFPRGPAKVYRKVEQVDKIILSDLFRFDDAVSDFVSYNRGGNSYCVFRNTPIPSDFSGNKDDIKKIFESELDARYSEICKIYERLPENIKIEALRVFLEPDFCKRSLLEAHEVFKEQFGKYIAELKSCVL